jgi:hypothetical protein
MLFAYVDSVGLVLCLSNSVIVEYIVCFERVCMTGKDVPAIASQAGYELEYFQNVLSRLNGLLSLEFKYLLDKYLVIFSPANEPSLP